METTQVINTRAFILYGKKRFMAVVEDKDPNSMQVYDAVEGSREAIIEWAGANWGHLELMPAQNEAEIDAEIKRDFSPAAIATAVRNERNRDNANRPFRR
uniref:Uncharacterized protein n=1 Tax=Serratia phage Kevin TaxID=3161161 RepID=A0AAU8KX19_9CAUD